MPIISWWAPGPVHCSVTGAAGRSISEGFGWGAFSASSVFASHCHSIGTERPQPSLLGTGLWHLAAVPAGLLPAWNLAWSVLAAAPRRGCSHPTKDRDTKDEQGAFPRLVAGTKLGHLTLKFCPLLLHFLSLGSQRQMPVSPTPPQLLLSEALMTHGLSTRAQGLLCARRPITKMALPCPSPHSPLPGLLRGERSHSTSGHGHRTCFRGC